MKGNTPKLIKKMIDDVEAAQADMKSGDPELMLHGFSAMISILSDQAAMLTENYPEDRRMREFLDKQIADMKVQHGIVAERLDLKREADARREEWRKEAAARETERKARQKAERAAERERAKKRALLRAEEKRIQDAKDAEEDARQGRFDLGDKGFS